MGAVKIAYDGSDAARLLCREIGRRVATAEAENLHPLLTQLESAVSSAFMRRRQLLQAAGDRDLPAVARRHEEALLILDEIAESEDPKTSLHLLHILQSRLLDLR